MVSWHVNMKTGEVHRMCCSVHSFYAACCAVSRDALTMKPAAQESHASSKVRAAPPLAPAAMQIAFDVCSRVLCVSTRLACACLHDHGRTTAPAASDSIGSPAIASTSAQNANRGMMHSSARLRIQRCSFHQSRCTLRLCPCSDVPAAASTS